MSNAQNSSGQFANSPAASQAGNPGDGDVAEVSETLQEDVELSPEAEALRLLGGDSPADGQAGTPEDDDDDGEADEAGAESESAEVDESEEEEAQEKSDDAAEQTEDEKAEESEEGAEEKESEEGEEAEEDEHKVPPKLQARFDELTAARRSAEETLINERKLTAKLQEQIVMTEAARNDPFGLFTAGDTDALNKRAAELEREAEHYEKVIDQGYELVDGERSELDPDRQKLINGYVRDIRKAVARSVPARQRYFTERSQWDAVAVNDFPWLKDAKDERTLYAGAILSRYPNLSPSVFAPAAYAAAVVAHYELEIVAKRKAAAAAAKGTAKGTAQKAPGKQAAPVKKRSAAPVAKQQQKQDVDFDSDQETAAWVANQL